MKKLILLLLLFPFVTFSQSVFSPKSNPNSLGIAKDFSDKNSIDKPLNYTIENSAEEELELILDFINKENFEGALLLVNSTIKKFPDFKPAFFIRGKIRTVLKYYNEAISDFKVLLNSEPSVFLEKSKPTAYMYIGLSEYYLKNYKESLINLNKSIEYESDSEMTSSVQELIRKVTSEKVASDLERYKNQTKVVPVFDKPKSNFSSSEVNSFKNKISNKSFFNSQERETYTGISSSDGIITLEIPNSMDALNGYPNPNSLDSNAITYYNKGVEIIFDDVNKAVDYFIMAINYDSKFVQAYDNLGKAYRMLKKYDLAIKSYELSLKVFPKGTSAHQNLAIVYSELGNYSKAIDEYNIVIKMLPSDPEGYYGLANTYLGISEFNKALPIALKALKLYEKNPPNYIGDSYAQITLIYYYLREMSMAKKYMEISKEKFTLNNLESNFYDTFPQKIINEIYVATKP